MNVLVLGNGFDLWHKLPTTYLCFLASTEYLVKQMQLKNRTIGEVFSAIQDQCSTVKNSYMAYKSVYDQCIIPVESISELIDKCEKNCWWKLFKNYYNQELGWIDFEKEIFKTIVFINAFIDRHSDPTRDIDLNKKNNEIATFFMELFEKSSYISSTYGSRKYSYYFRFKSEYCIKQEGSRKETVNKEKVAEKLVSTLEEFSMILGLYFILFVEKPLERLLETDLLKTNNTFKGFDKIITFNYTNSFEKIYKNETVAHIHGSLRNRIVLGINSNQDDEADGDLTYIGFKKYYQRVVYGTDLSYLGVLQEMRNQFQQNHKVSLSIVGHSLDETDKDSLQELFEVSNEIRIYYYKDDQIADFTRKLIHHFGKTKFDELRYNRRLQFLPLESISLPTSETIEWNLPFQVHKNIYED